MNVTMNLLPIDKEHLPQLRAWRNDYSIWKWCRQNDLISDIAQQGWYERQAKDPSSKMYRIEVNAEKYTETVGVCGLTNLDFANRHAEFSIYVGPEHQKRGYGKKALSLLLSHGFQNLGLNLIWGETFDGNPALALFEAMGFRKDGMRRQFYWKDGKFIDAHLLSLTREEWLGISQAS